MNNNYLIILLLFNKSIRFELKLLRVPELPNGILKAH